MMNERIRELSAIAKNLATDEATHLSRVHNRTLSLDEEQEIFTTKFAELIVKECVAICQDMDGEDNTDARSGRQDCAVEIREHFGVEE